MKTIKFLILAGVFSLIACNSNVKKENAVFVDSTKTIQSPVDTNTDSVKQDNQQAKIPDNSKQSVIMIYNFHVTNRCPSCIAIEEATIKTLNTYFAAEVKQGRIIRQIVNVDEEANSKIAEKYQAFGSGLFITRVFKGKETTTDMTGDGFKFARNKEARFIELLKTQISEYLK